MIDGLGLYRGRHADYPRAASIKRHKHADGLVYFGAIEYAASAENHSCPHGHGLSSCLWQSHYTRLPDRRQHRG